jgi:hypothetical protein
MKLLKIDMKSTGLIKNMLKLDGRLVCCLDDFNRFDSCIDNNFENMYLSLDDIGVSENTVIKFLSDNRANWCWYSICSLIYEYEDYFICLRDKDLIEKNRIIILFTMKNRNSKPKMISYEDKARYLPILVKSVSNLIKADL